MREHHVKGAVKQNPLAVVVSSIFGVAFVLGLGLLALRPVDDDAEQDVASAAGTVITPDDDLVTAAPRSTSETTDAPVNALDDGAGSSSRAATVTTELRTVARLVQDTTTTSGATSTTAVPTTTTSPTTTTTVPPPTSTTLAAATYDTLPDGSPVPVIAIFDVSVITLSGAVPDEGAVERLSTLALANSKTPATINNQLTINPAVPRNVGVRVIELTSTRFPESSFEIMPPHALELDRVANVMNALPNVSVLVVGHADQRGDDATNFRLSEDRARAVVTYLTMRGIAPARLSSRAVGEADLLSLNNDEAALALNRRTEFVFYGLINT